jgi:hypothetical protein
MKKKLLLYWSINENIMTKSLGRFMPFYYAFKSKKEVRENISHFMRNILIHRISIIKHLINVRVVFLYAAHMVVL